jgi:hypothetical protein
MKDLPNKPDGHVFYYQLVVFIGIIALIISRSPDLFWYPRFWAEEGTLYFKSIYENNWLEGLFFIPRYTAEYIALPVNIPLTIAAHFAPLEYATTISTYFSLLIMLIPFMIVLWGNSYLWDTPIKKILTCLIILLAPTSTDAEVWLNTINLQVHCGIIAVCLLFEKSNTLSEKSAIPRWLYRFLLLFCGLSGPYTTFLIFVFLLKAWHEKKRESLWHFIIVLAGASIQITLFLLINHWDMVSPTKISHFDWIKTPIYIFNYHIMTPLLGIWVRLGPNIEDVMRTGQLQGTALWLVSFTTVFTMTVIFYLLTKNRPSFYRLLLLMSFISVSLLTTYGSMHGTPYGRYAVIPSILFLLLILDNIHFDILVERWNIFKKPEKPGRLNSDNQLAMHSNRLRFNSLFLLLILSVSFIMGWKSFQAKEYWMAYTQGAPKWHEQIIQWQQNPDHLITSWPYPWSDNSWKFYLSHRKLTKEFQEKIHAIGEIHLTAQNKSVEKQVSVNGLPIDFHLIFVAQVIGDMTDYTAEIIFLGSQNEFFGKYSINQALNQQSIAILDFYSVDRRTQPHEKILSNYQNVKKIIFRLQSKGSTALKMTQLKVTTQKMSVF